MHIERLLQYQSVQKEATSDKEAVFFYASTKYDYFLCLHQIFWQPYIAKYP